MDYPVKMTHPSVPGASTEAPTRTSREALEGRGWRPAIETPPTVLVEDLSRSELDDLARAKGLDPAEYRTKGDLASALSDATDD